MAGVAKMTGVDLVERDDRWLLPLDGRCISQCCVDFAVTFRFSDANDTFEVRVGEPFVLSRDGHERVLNPEEDPTSVGSVLSLLHQTVSGAVAFKDGRLELSFSDGASLNVPVGQDFEAWELVGPGGLRVVSLPGGDLAVWRAEPSPAATSSSTEPTDVAFEAARDEVVHDDQA